MTEYPPPNLHLKGLPIMAWNVFTLLRLGSTHLSLIISTGAITRLQLQYVWSRTMKSHPCTSELLRLFRFQRDPALYRHEDLYRESHTDRASSLQVLTCMITASNPTSFVNQYTQPIYGADRWLLLGYQCRHLEDSLCDTEV